MVRTVRECCIGVALLLYFMAVMSQVVWIGTGGLLSIDGQWWKLVLAMSIFPLGRHLMVKMSLAELLSPETRGYVNQGLYAAGMLGCIFDAAWLLLQYFAAWLVVKWLFCECRYISDKRIVYSVMSCIAVSLVYGTYLAICGFRYDIKYRSFKLEPVQRPFPEGRAKLMKEFRPEKRTVSRRERCLTLALFAHLLSVWAEGVLWVRDATAWGRDEWVGGVCVLASMVCLLKYSIVFFEQPLRVEIGERRWLSGIKGMLAVFLDLGFVALQVDLALFALVWVFAGPGSSLNVLARTATASVIVACLAFGCYMAYRAVKFDINYHVFIPNLNHRRIPSKEAT